MSMKNSFSGKCDVMRVKTSPLFQLACVVVRLDHVARGHHKPESPHRVIG
jgi:hypothetical protein